MTHSDSSPTYHSKSEARLAAVEALYLQQMNEDKKKPTAAVADVLYCYDNSQLLPKPHKNFLYNLVQGVLAHQNNLDLVISKHLMDNWKLERLGLVTQSILRAATFELAEYKDTPLKVIINEYINVAHCFCDEKETSFINGILDHIATYLRQGEPSAHE